MGALDRTHQVIDVIEGRGEAAHSAVTPHDSTVDAASGIATARAFICPTYALTPSKEGRTVIPMGRYLAHGAVSGLCLSAE